MTISERREKRNARARAAWARRTDADRQKKVEKDRRNRARKRIKMMTDYKLYAEYRSQKRERNRKMRDKNRKRMYHEVRARRIPDWATYGQDIIDRDSRFLLNNINTAQKAWVTEFLMEQKKRCAC